MTESPRSRVLALLLAVAVPALAQPHSEQPVRARHAMVVTIQHNATDSGVAILKEGGNAIDAAVAVAFSLAVVYPQAGNIGGGGFMLIRMHDGTTHFLDYREEAPAAASTNMYLDAQGNVVPGMSTLGYKASGVPGTVAGLVYAQSHFGKLTLAQDMAPAIALATNGFVLTEQEADNLHAKNVTRFPVSAHIFQRDGNFYQPGDTFRQPELAETLRRIAADPDTFYKGAMAQEIATFEKANGGLITAADLAAYQVKDRAPILGNYRGYQVITAPPPSSGGLVLVEILNILSGYHLRKLGPDRSVGQVHIITEAFRRAYMDRADYLGDPDFTPQPVAQMTNPRYAAAWRKTISRTKPTPSADLVRPAGFMPPPPKMPPPAHESMQTTHFSIVDSEGNAVANTFTLNNTFGSGVTVAGLGFLLNDEMDDFASKQGVPNMYGLIQGPANAIAPFKRPLSAMTPTIITRKGQLRYVLGSPGGSTIITTVANDIISTIDNHLNIQQAADAPRFHHQYLPDRIDVEKKFPIKVVAQLRAMGYAVHRDAVADEHNPGVWGDSELIAIDPKTHELLGGHDNRHDYGKAEGY
ncbi:gamma-glutamyltranspeptidase [Edaphobacter acidisoli]|uniref:Glutathione hydrolase proenzyme n=1 Tax=Edaphobacter acidisoli TaxID=2040573 RepID=A0A916RTN7_9BACT|nr:gamma-glutamyltransferase [Edaphobacter acidisoli]GGA69914.1 gamma-glutamyltranspeptidase [Edaphobacter acidisoli]